MTDRWHLVALCLMSAVFLVFFQVSRHRLSDPWEQLVLDPEFRQLLLTTMAHERELARLDPAQSETYRISFEQTQGLLAHLEILEANRHKITRRYNMLLLGLFGGSLALIVVLLLYRGKRQQARLEVLGGYLGRLAAGETDLVVAEQGRDVIGRIGQMIQSTSRVLARASQRIKAMENLASWQESSRRMAHEIRTPLTTLRLEVDNLVKACMRAAPQAGAELARHEQGIREEMAHLTTFTDQYTSFAKIGKPHPKPISIGAFVAEFIELYGEAWPNLALVAVHDAFEQVILMDRRLVRQVLVNLCNNSAKAMGEDRGQVRFSLKREGVWVVLHVADTGPGVPPDFRGRLFQPYATTRDVGEGTGLGLAISKKVLLDHGGDLELDRGYEGGAGFRLIFPTEVHDDGN